MSAWYLLWMFVTALGIIALGLAVPFLWAWASEGTERAEGRQYDWRIERRRRQEIELYGQPLRSCLYCGSECEFGPNCANRDLSPADRARRNNERLLDEMPHLRERANREMAALAPADVDPVKRLPCPCARCGKTATLFGAFQNNAGHIFCGWTCYKAGGES